MKLEVCDPHMLSLPLSCNSPLINLLSGRVAATDQWQGEVISSLRLICSEMEPKESLSCDTHCKVIHERHSHVTSTLQTDHARLLRPGAI